ncbi:unnamed protein product [Adineta ricciae]|uniref:G-protein coupled receptors family 1 profile domain-containing protein n=1 Tax=Adineta ricciae TaxID=249248 RepID=A0A815CNP1_ADIRI|nr:unnamed protein product [Adineta ricciae]CAF1385650.1 unnamed protein product [Adineta ricciae]
MAFSVTAILVAFYLLILIIFKKELHTVNRLLTCNTCLASILYCVVQFIDYIYLLIITWDTSDQSCRWRAYFSYMSLNAIIYSYVLQIISRFFFINLYEKYRWLVSLKSHIYLILFGWITILALPLPSLITKDVYFRPNELCWVLSDHVLHSYYINIAYYIIPILLIIIFSILIMKRIYSYRKTATIIRNKKKRDRDSEIFRNIIIPFGIYFLGGIPYMIDQFIDCPFCYSVGVVTVTFVVNLEKLFIIYLDRDIRNIIKNYFYQTQTPVIPITLNPTFTAR